MSESGVHLERRSAAKLLAQLLGGGVDVADLADQFLVALLKLAFLVDGVEVLGGGGVVFPVILYLGIGFTLATEVSRSFRSLLRKFPVVSGVCYGDLP